MQRVFQILAAVLLGIAAYYLLLREDTEVSFVAGVLSACAFFLSVRFQIKSRVDARITTSDAAEDEENEDGLDGGTEIDNADHAAGQPR